MDRAEIETLADTYCEMHFVFLRQTFLLDEYHALNEGPLCKLDWLHVTRRTYSSNCYIPPPGFRLIFEVLPEAHETITEIEILFLCSLSAVHSKDNISPHVRIEEKNYQKSHGTYRVCI